MKKEIKIPSVGESIHEVTIASFLKKEGEFVKENEEILEIETDKANQALYAPASGKISWQVQTGQNCAIGMVIGFVETEATPPPSVEKKEEKKAEVSPPPEAPQAAPAPVEKKKSSSTNKRKKMSKIRQTIAKKMVEALHQSAMLTTFNEVDMTAIMQLRVQYKEVFQEKYGVKLGLMSFFVKAIVQALQAYPEFNSYIEGEEIVERESLDIGVAVGTDKGVMVPVIRSSDKKSFAEIEKEIAEYATKARSGKITVADLEGGSFTITNGGVYGSLLSTPLLNPPQVGILGMHKILERPIAVAGKVEIRPMMYLALSYDHRMVDGKEAVSFLVHIKENLEDPVRSLFFAP